MKALIVVDMQKGFLRKDIYKPLINKINNLIENGKYDKVIFTKFYNEENSLYTNKLNWFGLLDEESQKIEINVPKNSIIIRKSTYGLKEKDIEIVKSLGINEIDICGVQTDACVYAIALNMFDNGIFPNVLINYTQTVSTDAQENCKNILIHQFGSIDERE